MKKNSIISILISCILVFSITISLQIEGQIEQKYESANLSALTTHVAMEIKSNADFNNYAVISEI